MNQTLKDAIREVEVREWIDAKLAAAEARGGLTPHKEFMAELRTRFRTLDTTGK